MSKRLTTIYQSDIISVQRLREGEKQNDNIREEKRTDKPHNVEIAFGNGRKACGNVKIYPKAILGEFERVRDYE